MNSTRLRRLAALAATAAVVAASAAPASAADLRSIGIATTNTAYAGVLDVAGGSTAPGAKVIQYSVTGGSNQRWDVIPTRFGSRIVNVKSQLCLTTSGVAGQQLYVTYCNDDNWRQAWVFDAPQFKLDAGLNSSHGRIFNNWTHLSVDVQGGSSLAGTPVVGWPTSNGDNQQFAYWLWN